MFRKMSILFSLILMFLCACGENGKTVADGKPDGRVLSVSLGKRIASLDPALAADTASQYMVAAFYDTPLQYSYSARPYRLEPSMLASMPEVSKDMKVFRCILRDDLYFQDGAPFSGQGREARKVKASDMVFSILRLADARLKSTGYWLVRNKISGIGGFRTATEKAAPGDMSPYDSGCAGLKVIDDLTFEIILDESDPRFIYAFALPYFSAVSRKAVEFYGQSFGDNPCGSGPFILEKYIKDYSIKMKRNSEFRLEFLKDADFAADRTRALPLLDGIVCYLVKQPLASWLMFLQGELDYCALDGENFEAVVDDKLQLAPTLRSRGISLIRAPEFNINYIGFNFADPVLGKNENLRRAISLAFDKEMRIKHSNGRFAPAYGPVPPGAPGSTGDYTGQFGMQDIEKAKEYMRLAGYPDGIDPETGRNLELSFDQAGSDTFYRQTAELMATDMRRIGITLKPEFNNRARFLQKIDKGQMQMFRLSWTGDYPDAENFLQLFYGPNSGSCNRVFYRDAEYDRMYGEIRTMPDSPERTAKYEAMSKYLMDRCPWIFETYPVSFVLTHSWMHNYMPHDFGFNRWKYLSVDPAKREESVKSFRPISMKELRK